MQAGDSRVSVPTDRDTWRGGRVVYCVGLENRSGFAATASSNLALSAIRPYGTRLAARPSAVKDCAVHPASGNHREKSKSRAGLTTEIAGASSRHRRATESGFSTFAEFSNPHWTHRNKQLLNPYSFTMSSLRGDLIINGVSIPAREDQTFSSQPEPFYDGQVPAPLMPCNPITGVR